MNCCRSFLLPEQSQGDPEGRASTGLNGDSVVVWRLLGFRRRLNCSGGHIERKEFPGLNDTYPLSENGLFC